MWNWSSTTLSTYRSRFAALAVFADGMDHNSTYFNVVETYLVTCIAKGQASSTIRCTLSSLQLLFTVSILPFEPDKRWWKLSNATDRLKLHHPKPLTRIPFGALSEISGNVHSVEDCLTLALTILGLSLALRAGEIARLRPCDIFLNDPTCPGQIRITPEKLPPSAPSYCMRKPPPYILSWAAFLTWAINRKQHEPFLSLPQFYSRFTTLLQNTSAAGFSPHSMRRACAQTMWGYGIPLPTIMDWCRWKNDNTAQHYIGQDFPASGLTWLIPLPPFACDPPINLKLVQADPSYFWPFLSTSPPTSTSSGITPRKHKRPRT